MEVLGGWLKGLVQKEEGVDQWRATGVVLLEVIRKMEVTKEMLMDKKKKFTLARLLVKVVGNQALSESEWIVALDASKRSGRRFADSSCSCSSLVYRRSTKSCSVDRGYVLETSRDRSNDEFGRRRERGRSVSSVSIFLSFSHSLFSFFSSVSHAN